MRSAGTSIKEDHSNTTAASAALGCCESKAFASYLPSSNTDTILPIIINFLKEHSSNALEFINLALLESVGSSSGYKESENFKFYLKMGAQSHHEIDDFLKGLSQYIEFRAHNFKISKVSLETILNQVVKEINLSLKDSLYSIRLPKKLPCINSNPNSIFIIFKNLIKRIIVKGREFDKKVIIRIKARSDKDGVTFNIQENGPKLVDEEIKAFFSMFEGKKSLNSSSMEAALAYEYAKKLGGNIYIESSSTSKTMYSIFLPNRTVL